MELLPRGLTQQSSTSGTPCSEPAMPLNMDRKLPKKGQHNPNILPHTSDAGDPYYAGDMYDPPIARSVWKIDT